MSRLEEGWEGETQRRGRGLMDGKLPPPLVVSQVSNRGRNFILQVADLMIQRVINGLIILMLNMASSNYTDLLSVKVWPHTLLPIRSCWEVQRGEEGGENWEEKKGRGRKTGREGTDGEREEH